MKHKFLLLLFFMLPFMGGLQAQNNALHFDGTNDYVDFPDLPTSIDFLQGFTFSCWAKWDEFTGNARLFEFTNATASTDNSIILRTHNSTGVLVLQSASGTSGNEIVTDNAVVETGKWYYITACIDNSNNGFIYVNGVLVKSGPVYTPQNVTRVNNWLGKSAWADAGDKYFKGSMDEVSVWNKALNQLEIIAGMRNSFVGTETGLALYYKFNQGTVGADNSTVNTLTNTTSNAINGTLTNFALTGSTSNWVAGFDASQITDVLSVSDNSATLTTDNSNATSVNVISNLTWTAVSSDSWLTVSPSVATTGSATLNISASAIAVGAADRTATITLSAAGVANQVITVTQTNPFTFSVSANTASLTVANSNAATVAVTSNTTWTAVSSDSWLTVSPSVATTGSATLNISASAIAAGADRTATIKLSAAGLSDIVINVSQINLSVNRKVLVLGAESEQSWMDALKKNIGNTNLFSAVDVLDVSTSTPTLDQLKQYNSVLVFSDADFKDAGALGNVLADYVDYGGGVVCTTFATASTPVRGRFNTDNYWAIAPSDQQQGTQATLGTVYEPTSPLMDGVTSFNGGSMSYRSTSTGVATGATRIADWSDGVPLIATKAFNGVNRVDLGFFPISNDDNSNFGFWDATTDGIRIITNALLYAASAQDIVITTTDPTNITSNSALGAGDITQLGKTSQITEHGIVWSTASKPTIILSTKTEEGIASATGAYTSSISDLLPNTTYYARAYAINALGTYYGNEVVFTTSISTAVSDINASQTVVYPNPTSEVINLTSVEGITSISITNLSGKTVWSGSAAEFPLSVSAYAKGIYLVNVVTEGGVKTEKVIVK